MTANGQAPSVRRDHRSNSPVARTSGRRASPASLTQKSSTYALSKKKRRLAVPCSGCVFAVPSVRPRPARRSASTAAPTEQQTNTWSSSGMVCSGQQEEDPRRDQQGQGESTPRDRRAEPVLDGEEEVHGGHA